MMIFIIKNNKTIGIDTDRIKESTVNKCNKISKYFNNIWKAIKNTEVK